MDPDQFELLMERFDGLETKLTAIIERLDKMDAITTDNASKIATAFNNLHVALMQPRMQSPSDFDPRPYKDS